MRPHDGGSLSALALNDLAALTVFGKPTDLLDSGAVEARLQRGIADISRKVEHFFALIEQGQVIRIPDKKLIRYVQHSEFADWIGEVEVFRGGDKALRRFAHWEDLDCWKFAEDEIHSVFPSDALTLGSSDDPNRVDSAGR